MGQQETRVKGLRSPLLSQVKAYWDAKRAGWPMPARRDLDPLEIGPRLLPHLSLLDVEAESGRLRYRLIGTRIVAHWGRDATGRYLDELEAPLRADVPLAAFLQGVAAQRRAERLSGWLRNPKGEILDFEYLALPLSSDGARVDMIFCGLDATPVK